jgi:choline dehydrogenase
VYAVDEHIPFGVNNHSELSALLRTDESVPNPDIVLYPTHVARSPVLTPPPENGYSIVASVAVPHSRGTLLLAGADVHEPPMIDPAYLEDERDVDTLVAGLLMARRVGRAQSFSRWNPTEATPAADENNTAEWRAIACHAAGSQFHPVGTCRIGVDGLAVVDPRLRVHGVDGLRVADASVMPSITSMNPNATVIAIAERAAALIRPR